MKILRKKIKKESKIVWCDDCGDIFVSSRDAHEMGEPNICCEHCFWRISNNGEPQPPHTCREKIIKFIKENLKIKQIMPSPNYYFYCHICGNQFNQKKVYCTEENHFCNLCGMILKKLKNFPLQKEKVVFT